jgi:quercetin dioxygenase-like cupin family protein
MRSFLLRPDGRGDSRLESLALPFSVFGPTATDDDRAAMPPPDLAREIVSVRPVRHLNGTQQGATARHLALVVSGTVELRASYQRAILRPGDVLFADDPGGEHVLAYEGDCRILEVEVTGSWAPQGIVPPPVEDNQRGSGDVPKLQYMFVADEKAHFRDFGDLFPPPPGMVKPQPALGLSLVCLSPDSFGDWHTEKAVNLVVVLSGGFELEVGGAGGAQVFRAGDICLVEDLHGQGHITRTHGDTRFAAIAIPDSHGWKTA